jgi:hypothetical protein
MGGLVDELRLDEPIQLPCRRQARSNLGFFPFGRDPLRDELWFLLDLPIHSRAAMLTAILLCDWFLRCANLQDRLPLSQIGVSPGPTC